MNAPLLIKKNVILKKYSTIFVGGYAKYFASVCNMEDLQNCLAFVKKNNLKVFVLGKGSNCLISDKGFDGLVIRNKIELCQFDKNLVKVGAGFPIAKLSSFTVNKNLSGLEFACAIPASVGGAVYMNAGANNQEMKDIVTQVKVMTYDGEELVFKKDEKTFSYRSSIFCNKPMIITEIDLCLSEDINAKSRRDLFLKKRRKTQPLFEKSIGCFFKNPTKNISAALLIDRCGLKDLQIGGAAVSDMHANFIVNKNNATCYEIKKLAFEIKKRVYEKFRIILEEEYIAV
jgi:UDP-N-acetylmuramate dehydrogenase